LPIDILVLPRQNPTMRGESENRVSLTRAALITGGGATRKFLLVVSSVLWLWLPVAGLASTRVVAWGAGTFSANTPNFGQCMVPSDLTNAIAIAAGCFHSLALTADGKVVTWRSAGNIPPTTNAVGIASGHAAQHSLVLQAD
jgi:Regulator of chromosome condensation (RCC1) repeat